MEFRVTIVLYLTKTTNEKDWLKMKKEKYYLVYKGYIFKIECDFFNALLIDYDMKFLEKNIKKVKKMKENYRYRNHEVYLATDFKRDFFDTVEERKEFKAKLDKECEKIK